MASIEHASVALTETTLRELLHEVERRKRDKSGDLPPSTIRVDSIHCDTSFEISLEQVPGSQESLAYSHSYPIIKSK